MTVIFPDLRSNRTWLLRRRTQWQFVGSANDYEVFLGRYKNAATPQEERRYMSLLSSFPGQGEMQQHIGNVRQRRSPFARLLRISRAARCLTATMA